MHIRLVTGLFTLQVVVQREWEQTSPNRQSALFRHKDLQLPAEQTKPSKQSESVLQPATTKQNGCNTAEVVGNWKTELHVDYMYLLCYSTWLG